MDNNGVDNSGSNLRQLQAEAPIQDSLVHIALRHRWIILSTTVFFLLVAFVYLLKATPIYTSLSRIYVEQTGPKIINEYEGVMTRSNNYLYTQGELIRSSPIVTDVVADPQIKGLKTFNGIDNVTGYIKGNLGVSIGKKDDIITISFDSPYPDEAARVVNAVVESYIEYHYTRKRSTVSEVLRILQKEKVRRDSELSNKFAEMLEFTRKNGVVSFDNSGENIVFDRLSKLSSSLTEVQLAALNAKADYEAVKGMANEPAKIKQFAAASATTGVHVFVGDRETELRSELRIAEMELKDAKYHCTDDHPSIKAIRAKIDRIKQELDEQAREYTDAYVEVMRLRWLAAKEREDELQVSFDTQRAAAQDLGIKAAEYSVLQSELKRSERICEILDNRIKELNITEDVGALNISILEVARPADSPSRPQKARIMAVALVLGLMLGVAIALLRDWMDYRLRSSEEIAAVLGVPVLGIIPTMSEGQKIIATQGQKLLLKVKSFTGDVFQIIYDRLSSIVPQRKTKPISESILARAAAYRAKRISTFPTVHRKKVKTGIVTLTGTSDDKSVVERLSIVARGQKVRLKPKSIVAEAYRTVRTAIFFGAPKGEAKTILVTSPAPGDGKSTLVSNLAITMAQAGQRTLVLDGDFRKPVQHKIFEIDDAKGLSGLLAGTYSMNEAVQPGPVKGLDILSCGPEVPNPSELLNSDVFSDILNGLSEQYDRIIIDSPPVGPVADSQILAATCDVVLLVLRAEKSTRRHSQQARDSLLSVGGRILGVIVNDVAQKRGRYGYYSRYGHYGGYGYYGHYGYYGRGEKKTG